ncbi:hypothetical protein [Methylicorpusculum sp.]|uniref:hypothetical protein n=1 Tax=Methylicorpusculum sp. TaxID=2713644 RepID=UPI002731F6F7|nr:hypothetical protein [Methylicorpusculum sp.]MDP2179356.1 hypothetical protein [Methylicorpusculum sp.]MDP3529481.1 hypothetical protein [Methylicorpusculum sp.]MDZ4152815.1 hypothetical protein [Methylicorpusculum sp.]
MKKHFTLAVLLLLTATNTWAGNRLLKETDIEAVALKLARETQEAGCKLLRNGN